MPNLMDCERYLEIQVLVSSGNSAISLETEIEGFFAGEQCYQTFIKLCPALQRCYSPQETGHTDPSVESKKVCHASA